jgi:hypothetical protein
MVPVQTSHLILPMELLAGSRFTACFAWSFEGTLRTPCTDRGAGGKGWPRRKGEEQMCIMKQTHIVRGDFISFICVYIVCKYIYNISLYTEYINIYIIKKYIYIPSKFIHNKYIHNKYVYKYIHKIWWTIQASGHVNFPSNPAIELMV